MRKKKTIAFIAAAALAAVIALSLFGCDRFGGEDLPALNDIYREYDATQAEIDTAELQIILPDGWQVLTSASGNHADSDIGYVAGLDAFIVVNTSTDVLSLVKVPEGDDKAVTEEQLVIPESTAVQAIHVVGQYLAVRTASSGGQVGVMNSSGRWVVNSSLTSGVTAGLDEISSSTLSGAIRILDDELVAINPAYENDPATADTRNSAYTPVYRISTGEMVCRVRTGGSLSGLLGFDGEYLTVESSAGSTGALTYIYAVPETRTENPNLAYAQNGTFDNRNGFDDYYTESLYLGDGRFYVHTEWTVDSDAEYTYSYGGEYYRAVRYFYYPDTDSRTQYNSSYIFLNCVNTYYENASGRCTYDAGSTSVNVSPSSFLNPGYTYSSFGLFVTEDKTAYYDQFILDGDLDIVFSLTGNFGIEYEGSTDRDEVGFYDMLMQCSDGYCYARLTPSALRVYRTDGSLAFENDDYDLLSVSMQNGIFIVGIDDDGDTLYGGFDTEGNLVIPFSYSYIEPFRSFYTYAVTAEGNTRVLLGMDGVTAPLPEGQTSHFYDIATAGSTPLEKRGCYAFYTTAEDNTRLYGVKNMSGDYSANTVLEASLTTCTIYSPSSDNGIVFVFGNDVDGNYRVYLLTSSAEDAADGGNGAVLPDWAIGLIAAGGTLIVIAAAAGIIYAARRKKKGGEA